MSNYKVEKANTGGVSWRPMAVPMGLLLVACWAITQVSAALLGYASALGTPWVSLGAMGIYAPWSWIPWTLKYLSTPAGPALMKGMAVGAVIAGIAVLWFIFSVIAHQKRMNAAQGLHGSASFANNDDVLRSGLVNDQGGVYVGAWKSPKGGYLYLRDNGPAHVLGFAPTRSGKGVGLVIPTMLSWPHSVVAYDIKGELWSLTAGHRSQESDVFCFAPTQQGSAKYNPFSAIRIGTPRETADIQIVAEMLVDRGDNSAGSDGSYWDEAAKSFLTGMITHCCYAAAAKGQKATFRQLLSLIANPNKDLKTTLEELMKHEHSQIPWKDENGNATKTHPVVARQAKVMHGKEDKDRSGVFSTVMACLRIYDDPLLTENMSASSFEISDLVNRPKPISVYIVVPPSDRDRLRPIVRLFFSQIIGQLTEKMEFQSGSQVKRAQRLLLMIDEFPSLGKMKILESALAYMAGYGLKAYLIAQDLTQIKGAYSEHEAVVANCHIRVAFAPNTVDTAELLSTMTGVTTVIHETSTFSGSRFSSVANQRSATVQFVERPLMTPDEIMRLQLSKDGKPGQQIVFIAGEKPILCNTILYYVDPVFSKLARISAPNPTVTAPSAGAPATGAPATAPGAPATAPGAPAPDEHKHAGDSRSARNTIFNAMNHFCEVQGTGYTGTDPTLRILSSGTTVVNLRICVHRRWQENNEWYSSETWLNLVFLNDLATDALAIQKGTQIYFSGSAADRSIDDRRSVFEITVKRWHRTGETAAPATDGDFYR